MKLGHPLRRVWSTRQASFVPFREAAERLHVETRAADRLLRDTGTAPSADACLEYHARQLLHYAKYGKVTLYGRTQPTAVMEPISRNALWTGKSANEMSCWITENGTEYAELSLPGRDLRRVMQQVKQSVKDHDALLAWCRRHAPSNLYHR